MGVMEDMERAQDAQEPEPSLDELLARFEAGKPVKLARSPRRLVVEYRYVGGHWQATSPELTGFEVSGPSLHEIRQIAKADLAGYLDPAVTLDERVPDEAETAGLSRSKVISAPSVVTHAHTRGRTRVAVSQSGLVSAYCMPSSSWRTSPKRTLPLGRSISWVPDGP